jgi:hypothetical protein
VTIRWQSFWRRKTAIGLLARQAKQVPPGHDWGVVRAARDSNPQPPDP